MFKKLLPILFLFAGFQANASLIYAVDYSVGSGSITGTITTDGYLGVLQANNIIGWDILVAAGAETANVGSTSDRTEDYVYVSGGALIATASALNFDYSSVGTFGILYGTRDNTGFYLSSDWFSGAQIRFGSVIVASDYTVSGSEKFASVVPEPTVMALFALGLVGIGFARRRQS